MNEERYDLAFQIITIAGDAKSMALMAIESAKEGRFEEAEAQWQQAYDRMAEAHEVQMGMVRDEIEGKAADVNIIMVHAQDHLTMATMALDFAKEFMNLYRLQKKA